MTGKIKAWLRGRILRMPEEGALRILAGSVRALLRKNMMGVAAQTAFYLLLAVFPLVLLFGSFLSPMQAEVDRGILERLFPPAVLGMMESVSGFAVPSTRLTIVSAVMSLWSASAGIWALMRGVGVMYDGQPPTWIKGRVAAFLVLLLFMVVILVQLGLWMFGAQVIGCFAQLGAAAQWLLDAVRLLMAFLLVFSFALALYAATPGFETSARGLVSGAAFAALGWQVCVWLFGLYLERFARYTMLYGGAGTFLGLAVWLLLICVVILLGAGINAALLALDERKKRAAEKDDPE